MSVQPVRHDCAFGKKDYKPKDSREAAKWVCGTKVLLSRLYCDKHWSMIPRELQTSLSIVFNRATITPELKLRVMQTNRYLATKTAGQPAPEAETLGPDEETPRL